MYRVRKGRIKARRRINDRFRKRVQRMSSAKDISLWFLIDIWRNGSRILESGLKSSRRTLKV